MRLTVLAALAATAAAFTGPAPTGGMRLRSGPAAMSCSAAPQNVMGKAAVASALAAALLGAPMMPASAETIANPYAKAGEVTQVKAKLTTEEKEAKDGQNKALFAIPLVGSVALSFPFFKRNLERMGEKASGKR
mmetsp:Transcript_71634/g.164136  ORF Transcript_71634/g.164136 Transcript_71634/m.164136 type:complete len:134 (+) Transcript_71634:48-449(+)